MSLSPSVVIEWVQAGLGNATVKGNSANNYLQGRDLDDRLFGRGGADHLVAIPLCSAIRVMTSLMGGPLA